MWSDVQHAVAGSYPQYNDYLLCQFRPSQIERMAKYLDAHFKNAVHFFRGQLSYVGYKVLSPIEAVRQRLMMTVHKRTSKVNRSTLRTVRFIFKMHDQEYYLHVTLPYMVDGRVYIDDTENYPLFMIIERLVHKADDFVTINPAMVRLLFYRNTSYRIKTTGGKVFSEFCITTKIHHAAVRRSHEKPPLALYHLIEHGFSKTLQMYDISAKDLQVVPALQEEPGFVHFLVKDGAYIRVRERILSNKHNVRFIISLTRIFHIWKHFTVADVYNGTDLYKIALGRFVHPSINEPARLFKYMDDHMVSYGVYLDPATKRLAAKSGYPSESMSDLLLHVRNNIDTWLLRDVDAYDLYSKKIGALSAAIAPLIVALTDAQYEVWRRNPRQTIPPEDIQRFVRRASSRSAFWFERLCQSNPEIAHNNWLFSIGLKMRKDPLMTETNPAGRSNAKVPANMMITHPSWLAATSIVTLPSNNPLVAGTINPYLQIDEDGNIIEPEWSDEIAHVCD